MAPVGHVDARILIQHWTLQTSDERTGTDHTITSTKLEQAQVGPLEAHSCFYVGAGLHLSRRCTRVDRLRGTDVGRVTQHAHTRDSMYV